MSTALIILLAVWNSTSKTVHRNIYGSLLAVKTAVSSEVSQYVEQSRQLFFVYSDEHQKLAFLHDETQSDQYVVLQLNEIRQTLDLDLVLLQNKSNAAIRSGLPIMLNPSQLQEVNKLSEDNSHFFVYLNNELFLLFASALSDVNKAEPTAPASLILGKAVNKEWLRQIATESGLHLSLTIDSANFTPISTIKDFDLSQQELQSWTVNENYLNLLNPSVLLGIQRLYTYPLALSPVMGADATLYLSINAARVSDNFVKLQVTIAALAFITVVVAGILGFLTARRIAKPLQELAQYTNKIAMGEYQDDINMKAYSKEFAQLINAFKKMQSGIAQREKDIQYLAQYDLLTALPNRNQAKHFIESKLDNNESLHVVMINIMDFRSINDMFGSDLADDCLRVMANRINKLEGYATRLNGGKFLWFPPHRKRLDQLKEVRQYLAVNVVAQGVSMNIKVAIGALDCPTDANSMESIFRKVTVLVEAAKHADANTIQFQQNMEQAHLRRLEVLTQLTIALEKYTEQLSMVYQPIQDIQNGKVSKLEALLRWQHPNLGNVPPDEFINIAENAGIISQVSKWVINKVFADRVWFANQGFELDIAINLSAVDIMSSQLLSFLKERLEHFQLSSNSITLELTESVIANDTNRAIDKLEKLHHAGFDIAIDDFGTGYSSLSYLASFPANIVKIDRSFVSALCQSEAHNLICKRVIQIARDLKLTIVAEGVEDQQSIDILRDYGCQYAQGYFIAKPNDKHAVVLWLTKQVK